MGKCILCEDKPAEYYFGSFCTTCRKIKNLGNVYGFERIYNILSECCIRDPDQLEAKILKQKQKQDKIEKELVDEANASIKLTAEDKKDMKKIMHQNLRMEK